MLEGQRHTIEAQEQDQRIRALEVRYLKAIDIRTPQKTTTLTILMLRKTRVLEFGTS
jgi:hypothetical protein